ncbi:Chorismate mutase 1-like protein [Boothiomyces macroporosus]|uniref:Chorismate mutase n=1 Tax=Boothiomyces macroporosus TaxID=261099 RepID=A0AAD5UHN2_9FUNG|nr:Chorismate mutase 1-like protein [Boothiomyces macroporosus]
MNYEGISLSKIRSELVRLEDTIIFGIIERSQFALNSTVYKPNQFKEIKCSFLEYFLHNMECVHAKVRRYTSPDEYPFTKDLPEPVLPPLDYPKILLNINPEIMQVYINNIVPAITKEGDDLNYGSSCTKDVELLQTISRRIHFGKFVAEAKFNDPKLHDKYVELIKNKDEDGIMELLTNKQVELKLLRRLKKKALIYGQEIDDQDEDMDGDGGSMPGMRLNPSLIADIYEKFIIPLTKKVEVEYLLQRLDSNFNSYNL